MPAPSAKLVSPMSNVRRVRTNKGRTNLADQACRSMIQSASTPALLPSHSKLTLNKRQSSRPVKCVREQQVSSQELRSMQTATWAVTLAPQCSDWTTESRDATQGAEGAVEKEKLWVEGDRQRTIDATRSHNRMLFCRARDRLNQLVCHKFGSLKAMFNKFKVSESGVMSLDEFSAGLKRQKLENVFPREYQRIVFEALGQEYVERMQVHDLLNILNPDMDKYSQERVISFPLPEDAGLANRHRTFPDPTCVVDKPLLPDELHPIKSKIVDALFHKTRLEKRETGVQEQTEFLMNAFRQLDANMSGTLAPDEILMALGPRHLDLKLDNTELRRLVDFIGKSCDDGNTTDALISYKTFVRFLEITDIEPDYSPFFDHRNRELLALKRFSELPWQWNNPGWDENSLAPDHDIPEIAEAMRSKDADAVDQPYVRPMFSPQDLDAYNKRIAKMGTEDISEARRPLTSSGNIFADLRMTNRLKLLYTRPLFVSPPPTDWTRTGCGGNGISTESGLYLPSCERFITTSQSYFKPLRCNPNGSMSRDTVSDAEKVMNERKRRARARLAKNNSLHRDMAWRQRKREQMRFMNEEQKLLQKASELYDYHRRTYEKDLGAILKSSPEMMQKRSNVNLYTRMWGGSPNNMLHPANRLKNSVER